MRSDADKAREDVLRGLGEKYVWWLSPEATLARPTLLACQVMQLGTWEDFVALRTSVGDDAFRAALREAPPGVLDRKSWSFWTQFFGVGTSMPERRLPA